MAFLQYSTASLPILAFNKTVKIQPPDISGKDGLTLAVTFGI